MDKTEDKAIFKDISIMSIVAVLVIFAFFLLQHRLVFPDRWFPSHFAALEFMILFCVWILSEIINSILSRKNSQKTTRDKGSYLIIIAIIWSLFFIAFRFRSLGMGIFSGSLQYGGLLLLIVGIVLREWSIWVLGKHFTVQVQIREKAKLVKQGPYKYIRHPSYTGGILSIIGITLSIGTWFGALVAFAVILIVYHYRISIEEKVLQAAFSSEYEEYKKGTWKLFPGF